uniref:Putative two-component response regulator SSK1p n=1 Tax=Gibberella moniliformis TaxID=117187 RepID=Q6SLA6_GIBMO|nr:putative two-component response regulator SSK1p [[Gibberella] fujikuroi var. moniliformis]
MGATDIASRLRAKFTKRRHSTAGSQASSSRSITDTTSSSFGSRHLWDRDRSRARDGDGDHSSQRAVSNSRGTVSSRHGMTATPDGSHRQREDGDDVAKPEGCREVSEAPKSSSNSNSNSNSESTAKSSSEIGAEAAVPPANDNSTAPDTTSEPLKQPSPPIDQQSLDDLDEEPDTTATSSSDQLPPHSDLHPPQPHPRLHFNQPPLLSPSLHPPEQPSPSRLRQASSNLDRIHEDSQDLEPPSPTARPRKVASLELDAGSELAGHNDDDVLSLDQAPNSPKSAAFVPLAAATSTTFVAPSPGLPTAGTPGSPSRPAPPPRRQSLLSNRQTTLINTLLSPPVNEPGYSQNTTYAPINGNMVTRKIWVKRPHASPTLVTVNEDDLVDDVRDMILRKYSNSLGRSFDSPDGYFPSVAAHPGAVGSPHLPVAVPAHVNPQAPHSIAVLGTGHIPPIPSPGRSRAYRDRPDRPRLGRTHTSSPTLLANGSAVSLAAAAAANHANHGTQHFNPRLPHSRTHSNSSDQPGMPPAAPPLPTPPAPEPSAVRVSTPPVRPTSPRPTAKTKKSKKAEHPSLPPGMLNGGVPPINVLIVEDNPINLKLLEAFVKRLKVRWSTAMNGRDAVKKWRTGGFHLVLMDIQLPVMNGLEATREIRRLERVNSIGVFSSSPDGVVTTENPDELDDKDRLQNPSLFKSPVIIVALTASSLQSDRHEALAAGCNDFLTKPVNFVWLERKVMEWGCMQALIDFDGWRKWKEISQEAEESAAAKKAAVAAAKAKSKKNRLSMTKPG